MPALTIPQKDKLILTFGDIGRMLYDDPRRYTYDEVDEVIELFRERGYEIVPKAKPTPLALPDTPAPAATPPVPAKVSPNDAYWVGTVIQKYKHAKQNNITGFNFKNEAVGKLLAIACPILGIPFKP